MPSGPKRPKPSPSSSPPTIYRAVLGPHGLVYRVDRLSETQAVLERRAGKDVVVCGDDKKANQSKARDIEDAVGPNVHHTGHLGADSLTHYQPVSRPPRGHCFYEKTTAKSKKMKRS
jgi:hypothetical protein